MGSAATREEGTGQQSFNQSACHLNGVLGSKACCGLTPAITPSSVQELAVPLYPLRAVCACVRPISEPNLMKVSVCLLFAEPESVVVCQLTFT